MTLDDLECQNIFFAILSCDKSISFTRRCHGSNIICTSVWL